MVIWNEVWLEFLAVRNSVPLLPRWQKIKKIEGPTFESCEDLLGRGFAE